MSHVLVKVAHSSAGAHIINNKLNFHGLLQVGEHNKTLTVRKLALVVSNSHTNITNVGNIFYAEVLD